MNVNRIVYSQIITETREFDLVKQMSMASVTSADTIAIVPEPESQEVTEQDFTSTLASVMPEVIVTSLNPANFQCSDDFWPKSITTYNTIMNAVSTTEADEALEPQKLKEDVMEPVQVQVLNFDQLQKEMIEPEQVRAEVIEEKHVNANVMEQGAILTSLHNISETKDTAEMNGSAGISCKF